MEEERPVLRDADLRLSRPDPDCNRKRLDGTEGVLAGQDCPRRASRRRGEVVPRAGRHSGAAGLSSGPAPTRGGHVRIVYRSFDGRYSDNPRALYEALLARGGEVEHVWLAARGHLDEFPKGTLSPSLCVSTPCATCQRSSYSGST
jgi:hypothetical protein